MNKNIKYLIATFGILLSVIYLISHFTYMMREPIMEKTNLMGFYAEPEDTLDVVFIGSSTLRTSVNPIVLWQDYGITSYDIATSSQRPTALIHFLREVQKYQKDALYVIDVNLVRNDYDVWEEQNEGSIRHITDGMKYSFNRLRCINDIVEGDKSSYYFDILKYHSNIEELTNFDAWDFEVRNPWKGFIMLTDTVFSPCKYKYTDEKGSIPAYGENALRELLLYSKQNDINVEFIITESHGIDYKTCQCIKEIVEEYGFDCFVFNDHEDELNMDESMDFYDELHTTVLGSEKCTRLYGKYLVEKYGSFPVKSDKVTEDWNESVEKIRVELENGAAQVQKARYGKISVEIQFDGYTGRFRNRTAANEELEMALYIYERLDDGSEQRIDKIGYTNEAEVTYNFDPKKSYRIVAFIRAADEQETSTYREIAAISYNEEIGTFEIIK